MTAKQIPQCGTAPTAPTYDAFKGHWHRRRGRLAASPRPSAWCEQKPISGAPHTIDHAGDVSERMPRVLGVPMWTLFCEFRRLSIPTHPERINDGHTSLNKIRQSICTTSSSYRDARLHVRTSNHVPHRAGCLGPQASVPCVAVVGSAPDLLSHDSSMIHIYIHICMHR